MGGSRRMILAVAITLLVAVVISGAAYIGMRRIVVSQEEVARSAQENVTEIERLRAAFDQGVAYELGYLVTGEQRLLDASAGARGAFLASLEQLEAGAQSDTGVRLMAEVRRAEEAYARSSDALNDSRALGAGADDIADVFEEQVGPIQEEVSAAIGRLAEYKAAVHEAARQRARGAAVRAMRLVGGIAALALLAALGMGGVQIRASRREHRALQAWKEFLSIASHDLKSPLAAMRFQLAVLRRQHEAGALASGQLAKAIERLDRQSRTMADLVTQNLDVARLDAGSRVIQRSETDLVDIVQGVVERCRDDFERAGSVLSVDAPRSVRGRWDPVRLDQVVSNLLSNALKYGGGKPVELSVRADDRSATVRVVDHGPGIAWADQAAIFERFTRLPGPGGAGSHGLGLWIARRVVEAHGGRLSVQSAIGAGATFVMELPRWRDGGGEPIRTPTLALA